MADETAPTTPIGLGEALKTRRRQKNYTLEMVSQETRISTRFLRALEEEKWAEFPAKVYLEGFLRHYGSFLGLDGEDFVKKWREAQAKSEKPALTRVSSTHSVESEEEAASKSAFRPELIFLGALIIFLGALYFVTARLERSRSHQAAEIAPVATVNAPPPVPVSAELEVYANKSVWLRVWADHRVRFEGILPREGRKSWTGLSSFRIQSANVKFLDVTVNGNPIAASLEKPDEFVWSSTQAVTTELTPPATMETGAAVTPIRSLSSNSTGFIRRRAPAPPAVEQAPAPPVQ